MPGKALRSCTLLFPHMVILLSLNLHSWSLHNEILKAVKLFMCISKVRVLDAYLLFSFSKKNCLWLLYSTRLDAFVKK